MRPSIHWPASPPAGATIEVKCSAYQLEWERTWWSLTVEISSIDTKCHLSRGEGDWASGWGYWNQSPVKGLGSLQSGVALGERLQARVGRYTCIPHWSTFYMLGFSPWKRVVPDYYFSLCTKLYFRGTHSLPAITEKKEYGLSNLWDSRGSWQVPAGRLQLM